MELPVFYDQNKRRWKTTKAIAAGLLVVILVVVALLGPSALNIYYLTPEHKQHSSLFSLASSQSSDNIARLAGLTNVPVVGAGPLARVIKVDTGNSTGSDPFTGQTLRQLNNQDLAKIGSRPYAIERYGDTNKKMLALTFDDGPDAQYSPELLDLLARESVPSTFFVVGKQVIKNPELANRMVKEGHALGNHTYDHSDLDRANRFKSLTEINQTERIIRSAVGYDTAYFRPPYIDSTDQGLRNSLRSVLRAQQLGYTISVYDYDSEDWQFNMDNYRPPDLTKLDPQKSHVLLLHDGGGDRAATITYVRDLIKQAKQQGWQFGTLDQLYAPEQRFVQTKPGLADHAVVTTNSAMLVWPKTLVLYLFFLSTFLLVINMGINLTLAALNHRRIKKKVWPDVPEPFVAVVIAAYNEEKVLTKTVKSLLKSDYKNLRVIIVDDESTDSTGQIADRLAAKYKKVTALHPPKGGKSAALNYGIKHTSAKIVVCADADTIFAPGAIHNLVRHFNDPHVGAVAGTVKSGNPVNALARWQSLEYLTSIHVERNAQDYLGAVMIVPGACCAWLREAVIKAGGYSQATLAEDCDLTMAVRKAGYKIAQDNDATAYTECPTDFSGLAKQRFRWMFGNVQSIWKHKDMFLNRKYGWFGMFVIPNTLIGLALPIVFWPLLVILTIQNLITGNVVILLVFLLATIAVHFVMATVGLLLAKESLKLLAVVPLTRFVYGPLRTYLLYRTLITVLRGAYVGWDKLARSGSAQDLSTTKVKT